MVQQGVTQVDGWAVLVFEEAPRRSKAWCGSGSKEEKEQVNVVKTEAREIPEPLL